MWQQALDVRRWRTCREFTDQETCMHVQDNVVLLTEAFCKVGTMERFFHHSTKLLP